MRKVKVIYIIEGYDYDDEHFKGFQDASEWSEVTDEEYDLISNNLHLLQNSYYGTRRPVLIEQAPPASELIKEIREKLVSIEQEKKRMEKARKDREALSAAKKADRDRKKLVLFLEEALEEWEEDY